MKTRHQQKVRERDGIPPTPPQKLPSNPRPKRTTRQSSRSASAEPATAPSTTTRSTALSRKGGNIAKKSKAQKLGKGNVGRGKQQLQSTTPTGDDVPPEPESTTLPTIIDDIEVDEPLQEVGEPMVTDEPEGIISLSSTSPVSSLSGPPEPEMVPQDTVPAHRLSQTAEMFNEIVHRDSIPGPASSNEENAPTVTAPQASDSMLIDPPYDGDIVSQTQNAAQASPRESNLSPQEGPAPRFKGSKLNVHSRLNGPAESSASAKLPIVRDQSGALVTFEEMTFAFPISEAKAVRRHLTDLGFSGYAKVAQVYDEDGNRTLGATKYIPISSLQEEDTSSDSDMADDSQLDVYGVEELQAHDRMMPEPQLQRCESNDPQSHEAQTLIPAGTPQATNPQPDLVAAPETPRNTGWLSSFIPKTVTKLLPTFGRPTNTAPLASPSLAITGPQNAEQPATPQPINRRVLPSVTEPRRPHVSATQGKPRQSPRQRTGTGTIISSRNSGDANIRATTFGHSLPVFANRKRGRAMMGWYQHQEEERKQKRRRKQSAEEREKALAQENEGLKMANALQDEEIKRLREEKARHDGTYVPPPSAPRMKMARQPRESALKIWSREQNAIEVAKFGQHSPEQQESQNAEQSEQSQLQDRSETRGRETQQKKMKKVGRKRKRSPSPDVIPGPEGGGYGMNEKYFEISDDEDYETLYETDEDGSDEADDEETRVRTPPSKRQKIFSPSQPTPPRKTPSRTPGWPHLTRMPWDPRPTEVAGNPKRATPYKGSRFATPEKPAATTGNVFRHASVEEATTSPEGAGNAPPPSPTKKDPPPPPSITFRVPSPGSSDDESDYEPSLDAPTPSNDVPAQEHSSPTPTKAWEQQTPPPAAVEQPAPWDPTKEFTRPELSVMKQREQALKYAPKTPSRLFLSSRLSTSTVASDDQEDDDFTQRPRTGRSSGTSAKDDTPPPTTFTHGASYSATDEPSVPIAQPSVPTAQPSVPTAQPSVPTAQPSVPIAQPSVPTAQPSETTAQSASIPSFADYAATQQTNESAPTTQGGTTFESTSTAITPPSNFSIPPSEPGAFNAYEQYAATMSPAARNLVESEWKLDEGVNSFIAMGNFQVELGEFTQHATEPTQGVNGVSPRVQNFIDANFTPAVQEKAAADFEAEFAAFKASMGESTA